MALLRNRFVFPDDLDRAVTAHAQAVLADDQGTMEGFVLDAAREAHRAALEPSGAMRPLREFKVIARARLGHQYFVKVRFLGLGNNLTLQNRWLKENGDGWRIVEVTDLAIRSPWTRPEKNPAEQAVR
jgi:hypothetical protein